MNDNIVPIMPENLRLEVTEKTLGVLVTNAGQLKAFVESKMSEYDVSKYNEENIAQAKEDKALLNKAAKELNDKRLELEREFMKPFNEFKEVITETVTLIKECSGKIDSVVKEAEEKEKKHKYSLIEEYFNSKGFSLVPLSRIFSDKWLNKSASMKSIKSDIDSLIDEIETNLSSIEALGEDAQTLKSHYLDCLRLDATLDFAKKMKENREKLEKSIREPKEEPSPATPAESVKAETEQVANKAPGSDEIYERTFKVVCTRDQLIALGDFMNKNGIKFQKL